MIDVGILIKGFIAILESRASFIGATALEVGFGVFLYKHPDNETYLFWVIVLGVAIFLRAFLFFYDNKQREAKFRYNNERWTQAQKEEQEKKLAEAKHVYQSLSNQSQDLIYRICKIALRDTIEGSYIVKDKFDHYPLISEFEYLLNQNIKLLDWVDYDDYGDSFCFSVKSPLDKLFEKSINP